jgi:hypothetical protein
MPIITQTQTITSQAISPPLLLQLPANAIPASPTAVLPGILVNLSAGAVMTYNVEVTSIPNPVNAAGETWNVADDGSALTANVNLSLTGQVTAIRLNVTAFTSGTATIMLAYMN